MFSTERSVVRLALFTAILCAAGLCLMPNAWSIGGLLLGLSSAHAFVLVLWRNYPLRRHMREEEEEITAAQARVDALRQENERRRASLEESRSRLQELKASLSPRARRYFAKKDRKEAAETAAEDARRRTQKERQLARVRMEQEGAERRRTRSRQRIVADAEKTYRGAPAEDVKRVGTRTGRMFDELGEERARVFVHTLELGQALFDRLDAASTRPEDVGVLVDAFTRGDVPAAERFVATLERAHRLRKAATLLDIPVALTLIDQGDVAGAGRLIAAAKVRAERMTEFWRLQKVYLELPPHKRTSALADGLASLKNLVDAKPRDFRKAAYALERAMGVSPSP